MFVINPKYREVLRVTGIIFGMSIAVIAGWLLGNIAVFRWVERVAFYSKRDGNLEVYVMLADGSRQTRLTFNTFDDGAVTLSHNGYWIAFDSARDGNYEV